MELSAHGDGIAVLLSKGDYEFEKPDSWSSGMILPRREEEGEWHISWNTLSTKTGRVTFVEDGYFLEFENTRTGRTFFSSALNATSQTLTFDSNPSTSLYGRGAGPSDADKMAINSGVVTAKVSNMMTYVPYYYAHGDGYWCLGEIPTPTGGHQESPVGGEARYGVEYEKLDYHVRWRYHAEKFRAHINFADTLREATIAYNRATGLPPVPPKYTLGFIAGRWGWESREYIDAMLQRFRDEKYPIDAFFCDFEWFTPRNDYDFRYEGRDDYADFGYNNVTFPSPKEQIDKYHGMNIKFGGIRKPRLGNSALLVEARSRGFILHDHSRNMNFTTSDARSWYANHLKHYVDDGIDFWWNDEGETDYFTFHNWNLAQRILLREKNEKKKFFTINRAFIPGQQRLGSVAWTGDVTANWHELRLTPGYVINWGLAGNAFTACDIGGFSPNTNWLLLTRWYQLGVFMPIMRIHSTIKATPHFPFLWGDGPNAAMRRALILRARLIPYHYSLAHDMAENGELLARAMDYQYPYLAGMDLGNQFMDGPAFLVSPVHTQDSETSTYLPHGKWTLFNSTEWIPGDQWVHRNVPFGGNEGEKWWQVYVPKGAIIPIGPEVQYVEDKSAEDLEIHVYIEDGSSGDPSEFTMKDDDGYIHIAYYPNERRGTFTPNGGTFQYKKVKFIFFGVNKVISTEYQPFSTEVIHFSYEEPEDQFLAADTQVVYA